MISVRNKPGLLASYRGRSGSSLLRCIFVNVVSVLKSPVILVLLALLVFVHYYTNTRVANTLLTSSRAGNDEDAHLDPPIIVNSQKESGKSRDDADEGNLIEVCSTVTPH